MGDLPISVGDRVKIRGERWVLEPWRGRNATVKHISRLSQTTLVMVEVDNWEPPLIFFPEDLERL